MLLGWHGRWEWRHLGWSGAPVGARLPCFLEWWVIDLVWSTKLNHWTKVNQIKRCFHLARWSTCQQKHTQTLLLPRQRDVNGVLDYELILIEDLWVSLFNRNKNHPRPRVAQIYSWIHQEHRQTHRHLYYILIIYIYFIIFYLLKFICICRRFSLSCNLLHPQILYDHCVGYHVTCSPPVFCLFPGKIHRKQTRSC